ncbi:MAG: hypothetical protein KTR25_12090 [Myxococcales bacterium]|nr:hypothetical protein [Myxococcales bacterium]
MLKSDVKDRSKQPVDLAMCVTIEAGFSLNALTTRRAYLAVRDRGET